MAQDSLTFCLFFSFFSIFFLVFVLMVRIRRCLVLSVQVLWGLGVGGAFVVLLGLLLISDWEIFLEEDRRMFTFTRFLRAALLPMTTAAAVIYLFASVVRWFRWAKDWITQSQYPYQSNMLQNSERKKNIEKLERMYRSYRDLHERLIQDGHAGTWFAMVEADRYMVHQSEHAARQWIEREIGNSRIYFLTEITVDAKIATVRQTLLAKGANKSLMVDGAVNQYQTEFVVDTGSVMVCLHSQAWENANMLPNREPLQIRTVVGLDNKHSECGDGELILGGFQFSKVAMVKVDTESILGMNIIEHYKLIVDPHSGEPNAPVLRYTNVVGEQNNNNEVF
jgi:hypothetical protein